LDRWLWPSVNLTLRQICLNDEDCGPAIGVIASGVEAVFASRKTAPSRSTNLIQVMDQIKAGAGHPSD